MKVWFMRLMSWFALRLHIYYAWSRVYQWLYEKRKWEQVTIPYIPKLVKIEELLGKMVWREDPWWQLKDAISMPQATYGRYLKGEQAGDCDDISLVAAYLIEKIRYAQEAEKTVHDVGLLTCPWIKKKDHSVGGHNVCVFKYEEAGELKWAYVSNWFHGKIQYGFANLRDIINHMLETKGAVSIGWCFGRVSLGPVREVQDNKKLKLTLVEYHWE